jgi:chemotaxis protein MotA
LGVFLWGATALITIVGLIVVLGSVLAGYVLHHGKLIVLYQPTEFLIIGGAALGSLIVAAPGSVLKMIGAQLGQTITGKGVSKEEYIEWLLVLFALTKQAKTDMLALEAQIEKPETSDIFKKYPRVLANHHAMSFLCDTMKVQISSSLPPFDLEELMDRDLQAIHQEEAQGPTAVGRIGDAMPGLGIVAAVLGVVITMGKLSQGKEVIGNSVAGALVGTFLGILLSYGFIQPLVAKMENNIHEEGKVLEVIKSALIALAKEASPKVCVEYARRTIPPHVRPTFEEVDQATSGAKKAA